MRKALKQNLLEIFKTIYEAHEIVKGFIDKNEYENAQNILADCQDTAIQLGNLIEESEGEDFVTVSYLVEYCEALYEAATSLSAESNGHKVQKQLDKKIIKAENSAKNDIKVKLEIVFMPYKASMWDSLESVWKAADEDPDCDAYVVPIPYYDRKPNHSFGVFHYEGSEYPDYVPVVHYEAYNLEQRRPDVIYIHNPYDGNNYATSVDPRFYSSELKKYTQKLVYIPYFVLGEPNPDNEETVEKISHFVTVSGVINSDKVIVQSEAMRQVYIKILLKRFGDTSNNRKIVEDKILGIGSPKFDKAVNTDKDTLNIPESWKKIITKPDGTRKKIILYNTSLGALLEHNKKMLEKIKSVLEVFCENKDDIALLWRPHPLIKATIKSMSPQLWQNYKQIVDKYVADGWGIYDDTADLHRAIALSDGYYGDGSSIVQLCQKADMPIMIQNADSLIYSWSKRARALDWYDDSKNIWFCGLYARGLFCCNKLSRKTRLICDLPSKTLRESYRAICRINDRLYIAPLFADRIIVYSITENKIEQSISLDEKYITSSESVKFTAIYSFEQYVFFVPMDYKAIIRIDTETNQIDYFDDFAEIIKTSFPDIEKFTFGYGCSDGNKIYLPLRFKGAVLEFDMSECSSKIHIAGIDFCDSSRMICSKEYLYLLSSSGSCLQIINRGNMTPAAKIDMEEKGLYYQLLELDNSIIRIPCKGNSTFDVIDKYDYRTPCECSFGISAVEQCDIGEMFLENNSVLGAKVNNGKIVIYSTKRDSLCLFDKSGSLIEEIVFELSDEDCFSIAAAQSNRIRENVDFSKKEYTENVSDITLSSFIQAVTMFDKDNEKDCCINTIGQNVHKNLKENY